MSKRGKHHYVPIFYLKQWTNFSDKMLCEYKQRYTGVLPRRVFPDQTGYVHGLYSVPGLPKEDEQYVETKHMSAVDSRAALALDWMLDDSRANEEMPPKLR